MPDEVREKTGLFEPHKKAGDRPRKKRKRANDLDGKQWQKNSISVWDDIRKTQEERRLKHPALFPTMLVRRILESFTRGDERVVLDPFMGSGSALLAAREMGKLGIGFEVSHKYAALARQRLSQLPLETARDLHEDEAARAGYKIIVDDARNVRDHLEPESVDICVTSPPYWDILSRKRTADGKKSRDYGKEQGDLSLIDDYRGFLDELVKVFQGVCDVLKTGHYCVINVMDLRKKAVFFPYHSDLATALTESTEFIWDDVIIWDRKPEYNNIRPLGYPSVFRINKVHEYLLIMRKMRE